MNSHSIRLRVRYKETDQMGVVYYSNYLVWFEVARTEFFRSKGIDYSRLEKEERVYIPVVEAYCRYKHPLRYDDRVTVTARLGEVTPVRVGFDYEVKKDRKVAATGKTKHAFIDHKGTPIPIPSKVRKALVKII